MVGGRSTAVGGIDHPVIDHTLVGDRLAAVTQRVGAVITLVLDDVRRPHDEMVPGGADTSATVHLTVLR